MDRHSRPAGLADWEWQELAARRRQETIRAAILLSVLSDLSRPDPTAHPTVKAARRQFRKRLEMLAGSGPAGTALEAEIRASLARREPTP